MMYNNNIPSNYSNSMPSNVIRSGEVLIANRGLQHLNCILPQQNSKGGLFLGDVVCLLKQQLLEKHQIQSILTCMVEPISRGQQLKISNHKILPIRDLIDFPIFQYFNQSRQFIQRSRNQGQNILVHCHAGVSRSATIVCAYLMYEKNWNHEQALNYVREIRYRAKPNKGDWRQEYQQNQLDEQQQKGESVRNEADDRIDEKLSQKSGVSHNGVADNQIYTIKGELNVDKRENFQKIDRNQKIELNKNIKQIQRIQQQCILQQRKVINNIQITKKQTKKQNQTVQIKLQPQNQTYEDENLKKNLKKPIRRKIFQKGKNDGSTDKDQYVIRLGSSRDTKQSKNISQPPEIALQIPKVMSYNDFQIRNSHYQNYYPQQYQNKSSVTKNKYSFSPNMMKSAYYSYSPNIKNQVDEAYMMREDNNNNNNNNNNRNTSDVPMGHMGVYSQMQNNSMLYLPYKDRSFGYSNLDRNYLTPSIMPKANTVVMLNRSSKNQDLLNLNNNRNSVYYGRRQFKQ